MRNLILSIYNKTVSSMIRAGFGRIPFIRTVYRLVHDKLVSNLKKDYAIIDGQKMFLDKKDSLDLSISGVHEPIETDVVKKEIKPGYVIIDIGANIGYYTLIFSRLAGPKGKIYAFEPETSNFDILQKNIKTNSCENVLTINNAVSDKNQKLKFFISNDDCGKHSLVDSKEAQGFVEVDAVTLDDFFRSNPIKPDFVKIDIEGAEFSALKGMRSIIGKEGPLKMLIEFAPRMMAGKDAEGKAVFKFLSQDSGFDVYNLNRQTGEKEKLTIDQLISNYGASTIRHTNLFCIRE